MSATDAVETDAGWVVLDRLGGRLALLAGDGELVRTFGRKGEGPGELSAPVALAYTGERLVVAERSGRLVLFDREGAAAGVVRLRFPGCGAARVHDLLSAPDSLVMLTRCPRASGEVSARLELVTLDGGRRPLIEVAYNDLRHARVDPFRSPVVARVDGRLAIGFLPDRCLDVLDEDGTVERRLCYPEGRRRPFPDSALAVLRLIEERTGGRVEFAVPEHAPPFISVESSERAWGFVALLPRGGQALDLVTAHGLARHLLPPGVEVFLGRRTLLIAKHELAGVAFAVEPLG